MDERTDRSTLETPAPRPSAQGPPAGGRNNPTSHAAETAPFRSAFSRPMFEWLRSERPASSRGRILDFGCADLLLGRALDEVWVVDGYDEWSSARDAARRTQAELRAPGVVYDRLEDIPTFAYDVIVLNSLFQYTEDLDAAAAMFSQLVPLLATDASIGIVITDVVSDGSSLVVDSWELIRYCVRMCGPVGALGGIRQGINSGKPSTRQRLPQDGLAAAAASVGLELRRHPENLTEFSRRATFVLQHLPD